MRIQFRLKKRVVFNPNAIAYTDMPKSIIKFWKVLERWKRGMMREVFVTWKEPIKNAKLLFFDTQFNFLIFNTMMIFRIMLIYNLIINFSIFNVLFTIFWFTFMTCTWGCYMAIKNPREFPYRITYSLLYEFFWVFSYFHALINIRNQGKWCTR